VQIEFPLNEAREQLVFLDDVAIEDLEEWQKEKRLAMTLCDHNEMTSHFESIGASVTRIIDHHSDKHQYEGTVKRAHRIVSACIGRACLTSSAFSIQIEVVGSCSSLVAREYKQRAPKLLVDNQDAALLLLSAIVIDTVNLDAERKRATPLDHDMVTYLFDTCLSASYVRRVLHLLDAKAPDAVGNSRHGFCALLHGMERAVLLVSNRLIVCVCR
jgi:inorganic pyrophosphatase/exopolyphosphatase